MSRQNVNWHNQGQCNMQLALYGTDGLLFTNDVMPSSKSRDKLRQMYKIQPDQI